MTVRYICGVAGVKLTPTTSTRNPHYVVCPPMHGFSLPAIWYLQILLVISDLLQVKQNLLYPLLTVREN